jgi:hypothetical protein
MMIPSFHVLFFLSLPLIAADFGHVPQDVILPGEGSVDVEKDFVGKMETGKGMTHSPGQYRRL